MLTTLLQGFSTGASLIIAIGAQNAFVIRQGLLRRYLLLTALLCSLIDALLITLGILGFGHLLKTYPLLIAIAKYTAIAFLLTYGLLALRSALRPKSLSTTTDSPSSLKKTILLILALGLLNPHVYLDTVILLGSIASQATSRLHFAIGAILASFLWFFALTYGSRLLAPLLTKPTSWKVIDLTVALIMWTIALTLCIH
jgi:L-lysine exporter family protein LysE/ArgO